ncbi:MAG: NAD(P)/FAD-dependent oxidoreductase [Alphaproteobacteria bacterium]|nr:NAD(P)/FAD-dependent oxidoreductase [Alphaproteobacteria bacterium]
MRKVDVAILGAGAAGMFCAIEAARRGRSVLLIEHAKKPGEKIRISGGGRCNFTNLDARPETYLSGNPHFVKSALKRYTQHDFIAWVDRHGIAWHEKTLGQLFCDNSAREIIDALRSDMQEAGVDLRLTESLAAYDKTADGFSLTLGSGEMVEARSFVVASGGKSIPKMGATGLGYEIAERFGLKVTETRAGLVPLTFSGEQQDRFKDLAGVAVDTRTRCGKQSFDEAMLFTHRGLSGPAILQISSYWREGEEIHVRLRPDLDWTSTLKDYRQSHGKQTLGTALASALPKRLAQAFHDMPGYDRKLAESGERALNRTAQDLTDWVLKPTGSEGYRTAEVTLGGVDTHDLDSKTMQARNVPGLYFIGEVVDVTGWLGGYNFQWAWSSAWCAGQYV